MEAHQLRCFLATAELGSVTRAAARLEMAQPTLSQILLRLEDELGIRLFERTARGVLLTDPGRIFREHARIILCDMDRARAEVRQRDAASPAAVPIGLPSSVSLLAGARLVIAARERLPNVSVRLDEAFSGHIRAWLEEGRIEFGILHHADALQHLSVRRLAVEECCLVGPAGRFGPAGRHGIAEAPVSLVASPPGPLIMPTRAHGLRRLVEQEAAAQGIALDVAIEIDSLNHIRTLVAGGHGLTVLSHSAVQEDLVAGRLSAAPLGRPAIRRPIYLARNPTRAVTRASVRVEDLLVSLLRGMVEDGTWRAEWVADELAADGQATPG
ncbi:LysR family transcriptional regulator [Roseomonas sp. NAR14]|uniref:LysR family transcriptional regulator n=1 Tax=Roseomonas acroporae TaxID=2937791 RepID=A0A9X1YC80_9PROT|nr:LysR family transcriptional regulator [Roseomonas acroporae]MCK8786335.1 LysR family transcriptional regulator [Roseomonas acroporae]